MKTFKALLVVSILAGAGAANAATIGTFDVTHTGVISSVILPSLTGSISGSGTGAILDDSGTLTFTDSYSSTTTIGGTQLINETLTFNGSFAGGTFTATGGAGVINSCSGPNCPLPGTPTTTFLTVGGAIAASIAGGTITTTAVNSGIANVTEQFVFSNFQPSTPAVPVPAAAWLFGSGLLGLAGTARRRRKV